MIRGSFSSQSKQCDASSSCSIRPHAFNLCVHGWASWQGQLILTSTFCPTGQAETFTTQA
eukprot:m.22961 g.22961  ORF g.22961 m.22961 type:complete len:60 (-) comp11311_c0_seq1:628-807(-)